MPPGSILRSSGLATFSICFPAHVSHVALLSEVALASAPVPICSSKIWEVCFDVNTVLDDPPMNSGGATRSLHFSPPGGATRTRHNDAISGKGVLVLVLICPSAGQRRHTSIPTVVVSVMIHVNMYVCIHVHVHVRVCVHGNINIDGYLITLICAC